MTNKKFYSLLCAITLLSSSVVTSVSSVQASASAKVTISKQVKSSSKKQTKSISKSAKNSQKSVNNSRSAVNKMVNKEIKSKNFTGSDIVFGAARANLVSKSQAKSLNKELLSQSKKGNIARPVDIARVILNMEALGLNPNKLGNRNLVKELNKSKDITKQGSYTTATALLALGSGQFKVVTSSPSKVQQLINYLLKDAKNYNNEAWGFETNGVATKDIDTTSITVIALKTVLNNKVKYHLNSKTVATMNKVLKNATNFLIRSQLADGGFGYSGSKTSNVNSTAMANVALSTMNKDTKKVKNKKAARSAIDALIKYQQKNGTFKTDYSPELATGQALLGLKANILQANKKGSLYDFVSNPAVKSSTKKTKSSKSRSKSINTAKKTSTTKKQTGKR